MCPPLQKTCSCVIAQFNSLWRQRLTSVAFPCVLTQDAHRRLRNVRRVFLRFGTVFSFRSIRGFISFGKWRIFLTIRCKNWCQEISAYKLVNKLFKVVFLTLLAGVQNMREIMLIQWLCMVQFYVLPSPPGQPRGQVQPFRPRGGELFEAVLSRGEGGGAN